MSNTGNSSSNASLSFYQYVCKYWKLIISSMLLTHSLVITIILGFSLSENRKLRDDHEQALYSLQRQCIGEDEEARRIRELEEERDDILRELDKLVRRGGNVPSNKEHPKHPQ